MIIRSAYVRWTENRNMEEFLRLISTGNIRVEPLVTHKFGLDDAPKAYETILDPEGASLAVLLQYRDRDAVPSPVRQVITHAPQPTRAKDQLGIALVGAGNLARWSHLPAVQKTPGASIRAIFSASGVRGKSYARASARRTAPPSTHAFWKTRT